MRDRYHLFHRPFIGALMAMIALLCATGTARAEPSADDKALATMLFQEGRGLMSAGRIPEACQKLQESQRLDPGGGTILNLALCHEQEGRLARSWSEFKEAAAVARADGRRDRELEASSHVAALEPRLSRLTIVVPAGTQVEGLRIERDGHELGPGAWSMAIPALGREPFTTTVVIGKESEQRTVEIPVLATPVVVVTPPRVSAPPDVVIPPPMTAKTAARLRWGGIGTAGAGVLLLGGAGYALATALRAKAASSQDCMGDFCGPVGRQQRNDAVFRGNAATILGLSGIVAVGAGATLFYLGRKSSAPKQEARGPMGFLLGVAPGAAVMGIEGGF
jgi:hypothetical protein